MTSSTARIQRRELRAPRENRATLVEPDFAQIDAVVASNCELREGRNYTLQGRSLEQITRLARRELLRDALHWTAAYRNVDPSAARHPSLIFLAGHQPQLFHPGVWFKNFALAYLARRHGAVAVNLQIDSDTIKNTALRVPAGTPSDAHSVSIPLDLSGKPIPYEERRILDRPLFAQFGRRAAEAMQQLLPDPLVRRYWPTVVKRSQYTDNLGMCLAQSRHQLEGQWGLRTLEVPQSWVCQSESFAWLTAHILAQLPRFRETYNRAVREYREVHGIRNTAHPMPELAADGPWLESPFWVWSSADPVRRPLFARQAAGEIHLSDRHAWEAQLPLSPDGEGGPAVDRVMQFPTTGVKLRSRALITTLWARLVLGDLFLHGIGGAKYDQVTDVLIERFFGLKPPRFMVVSATLLLPVARTAVAADEARTIRRQLRELQWHPERLLDAQRDAAGDSVGPTEPLQELIAAKRQWIQAPPTPQNARARYENIRRLNESLQPWVATQREALLRRQLDIEHARRIDAVLSWREYGFPFYPADVLQDFLAGQLPTHA